jgi:hypothetical protein
MLLLFIFQSDYMFRPQLGKKQKKDHNTVDPQHIYVQFLYIYKNFIKIIDTDIW